jgi:osmoprotectant transport system permease protein
MADLDKKSFHDVAEAFLKNGSRAATDDERTSKFWVLTRQHVYLVAISLFVSILIGLPLGILAVRHAVLGHAILTISGLLQTIPSLALLCFLIPFFGIGTVPALVALFLYGLLPIVTGVHTGLAGLDPKLTESASALGLSYPQRLRLVDLPLASRSILAGIRTSAIIGIGTATLAALIGAGGYGVPIVTGLALNDVKTILSGAIPAAVMALFAHAIFEGLEKVVVPKGIR